MQLIRMTIIIMIGFFIYSVKFNVIVKIHSPLVFSVILLSDINDKKKIKIFAVVVNLSMKIASNITHGRSTKSARSCTQYIHVY